MLANLLRETNFPSFDVNLLISIQLTNKVKLGSNFLEIFSQQICWPQKFVTGGHQQKSELIVTRDTQTSNYDCQANDTKTGHI